MQVLRTPGVWLALLVVYYYSCCSVVYCSSSSSVTLPYVIQTPHYNVTWDDEMSPSFKISLLLPNSSTPTHVFSLGFNGWVEKQGNQRQLTNYTTGTQFAENIKTDSLFIQNVSITSNYTIEKIQEKIQQTNVTGISFTSILSNGARFQINYTVNTDGPYTLPIPRGENDTRCQDNNRFEYGCSCDSNHRIERYSVKFTFELSDWEFAPLVNDSRAVDSFLQLLTTFTGPFNIPYYYSLGDFANYFSFNVCDVAVCKINMLDGTVNMPFSFFSWHYADDKILQISTLVGSPTGSQTPNEYDFPVALLFFDAFEDKLVFDPDFSVLFEGLNNDFDNNNPSSEAGKVAGGGGGGLDRGALAGIIIGSLGGALLCMGLLFILSVVFVFIAQKKKASRSVSARV